MAKKIKGIEDLQHDIRNANKGTQRGRGMVEASLREVGAGRSILADREGRIIAGNKTLEAAADIGLGIRVVETDGSELVVVQRKDLDLSDDTGPARKLAYFDNQTSSVGLAWDAEVLLADLQSGVDLAAMFKEDELEALLGELFDRGREGEETPEEAPVTRSDVPDAVWPTDNDLGIPLLDIKMQADAFDQPWGIWGSLARSSTLKGTWLFYTEDERFEALWADPSPILNTKCVNAVEPNFSCYENMPPAVAIWQVYRKRWIARWWQQFGIRIFADLNVAENHYSVNRLGIPKGWRSFATRGYSERIAQTEKEYQQACEIAAGATPLFLCYGGGKAVKEACLSNGWLWIPEAMDIRHGKKIAEV